jgi:DNA N-6-adenine-methyltransferase (Dam)
MTLDEEFNKLIPPLSPEEYEQLETSIRQDGCRDPLVVWQDVLVDGHNRYNICNEHNIPYTTITIDLPDRQSAKDWMIRNQLGRRNLTAYQRAELVTNLSRELTRQDRKELASVANVSEGNISKVRFLKQHASDDIKHQLRNNGTTIHAAYQATKVPLVSKNTGCEEWHTPQEYIDAARAVLKVIDLDPASNPQAQQTVQATKYFTASQDGLKQPWAGKVWLNPPYTSGLIDKFICKLLDHFESNDVSEAIVLTNNATETRWFQSIAKVGLCLFPSKRIRFLTSSGQAGSPLQGQSIFYLGGNPNEFIAHFRQFGLICQEVK